MSPQDYALLFALNAHPLSFDTVLDEAMRPGSLALQTVRTDIAPAHRIATLHLLWLTTNRTSTYETSNYQSDQIQLCFMFFHYPNVYTSIEHHHDIVEVLVRCNHHSVTRFKAEVISSPSLPVVLALNSVVRLHTSNFYLNDRARHAAPWIRWTLWTGFR